MTSLSDFKERIESFYSNKFDDFWRWKLTIESDGKHILQHDHLTATCKKLNEAMVDWKTYRGGPSGTEWKQKLKEALENIEGAYNEIRKTSLLGLDSINKETLESI